MEFLNNLAKKVSDYHKGKAEIHIIAREGAPSASISRNTSERVELPSSSQPSGAAEAGPDFEEILKQIRAFYDKNRTSVIYCTTAGLALSILYHSPVLRTATLIGGALFGYYKYNEDQPNQTKDTQGHSNQPRQ